MPCVLLCVGIELLFLGLLPIAAAVTAVVDFHVTLATLLALARRLVAFVPDVRRTISLGCALNDYFLRFFRLLGERGGTIGCGKYWVR